ncbi:MAG: DUF2330 domain-containing protein [Deltaproteobacteria bacterium]|nr:DUF2330 domain-containing protein [Deltaproteobacteria bacterium]
MVGVTSIRAAVAALVMASVWWVAQPARACGGTFCTVAAPVDQAAERVVFAVDEAAGTTDMIVQVQYEGAAAEFAWVVPLAVVPVDGSIATFPQEGLDLLAGATAPTFRFSCTGVQLAAPDVDAGVDTEASLVDVHAFEEVGPYEVAVVESDEPQALVQWLRANGFRVSAPMEPFIAEYVRLGMKFLALKLNSSSKVGDIEPLRLTLPGTTPSIPLRMTALAAEPEMSLQVHILGGVRYVPANWPELTVDPNRLRAELLDMETFTVRWSWPKLIAEAVDEAGGRGWVTESAFPVADLETSLAGMADDEPGLAELRELVAGHRMVTRLATRVSPGEMTSDPMFRRSTDGDRPRLWDVETDCAEIASPAPCDFAACGEFGTCAEVEVSIDGAVGATAGCACLPGMTARTTMDPYGVATVSCIDTRMSFLNPGDRETPDATPLPDACAGFDCEAGTCIPMNGTPTCACDTGFVAVGTMDTETRERTTRCVAPAEPVDPAFYDREGPGELVFFPSAPPSSSGGCAAAGGGATAFALVGLLLLGLRRRR